MKSLTLRSMVIGGIGSVIITASSLFTSLKLSSLPWPIMFVCLSSMFVLKALGKTNPHEINVAHTAMSAGAMVAGGLAFTMPAILILDPNAKIDYFEIGLITVLGTVLGLVFTWILRKYFIEDNEYPFVLGEAASEIIKAGDKGFKGAKNLFLGMGFSGIFTFIRDYFQAFPSLISSKYMASIGGSTGIWISPMLMSMGYMLGFRSTMVWLLGGMIGEIGIIGFSSWFALCDVDTASQIKSSLGIGLMIGVGIGMIIKSAIRFIKKLSQKSEKKTQLLNFAENKRTIYNCTIKIVLCTIIASLFTDFNIGTMLLIVIGCLITTIMSSESVGFTGVNPMEVFAILIMLFISVTVSLDTTALIYIAIIIAIASGLTGDVMNDFKAGYIFDTNPKHQLVAQSIGSIIGAVVSVIGMYFIINAYGRDIFGSLQFPSAQSMQVAAMIGGNYMMVPLLIGVVVAIILYLSNAHAITLGLGVYLPFYFAITVSIGGVLSKLIKERKSEVTENKNDIASKDESPSKCERARDFCDTFMPGLLAGESLMGVIIAIIVFIVAM